MSKAKELLNILQEVKKLFKPGELVNIKTQGTQAIIVKDDGKLWVSVKVLPSYTKMKIIRKELTRI